MSTRDIPPEVKFRQMEWGVYKGSIPFRSEYSGTYQAVATMNERFVVSLTTKPYRIRNKEHGAVEAFLLWWVGGVNRVRVWHQARPVPAGTMRGSPTLAAAAVQGDATLKIATAGSLRAGDMFSAGGQLFQCSETVSPVGGVLTVPLLLRVRKATPIGTPVLWDRPTTELIIAANTLRASYVPAVLSGLPIEAEEAV